MFEHVNKQIARPHSTLTGSLSSVASKRHSRPITGPACLLRVIFSSLSTRTFTIELSGPSPGVLRLKVSNRINWHSVMHDSYIPDLLMKMRDVDG